MLVTLRVCSELVKVGTLCKNACFGTKIRLLRFGSSKDDRKNKFPTETLYGVNPYQILTQSLLLHMGASMGIVSYKQLYPKSFTNIG